MSLDLKSATYDGTALGGRVVEFFNDGALPPTCLVENLDPAISATIKYQEADLSSWADISGTTVVITPGTSDQQIVVSTRRKIALHVTGAVKISFTLLRSREQSPSSLS